MTQQQKTPQQKRQEELSDLLRDIHRDISQMSEDLSLAEPVRKLDGQVADLPKLRAELERLRARGYAFRGDLEEKLAGAEKQAPDLLRQVQRAAADAQGDLRRQCKELSASAARIQGDVLRNEAAIRALAGQVRGGEAAVDAAEERLAALARPFTAAADEVRGKVQDLHWTLDQFDGASFKLAPEERPVAAAKAAWDDAPGGEKPAGLLLFTDHRVRFEQKEERVTKRKFLLFAAETETVQRLLLDEPIGHLQSSDDSTRGWVMKDQLLAFTWARDAKAPDKTTFELQSGEAKDWDGVVELLRSGDLSRYEAPGASRSAAPVAGGAPPAAAAQKVRWPEKCAGCNAPLTAPVKGQTALACDYCGQQHAVEYL